MKQKSISPWNLFFFWLLLMPLAHSSSRLSDQPEVRQFIQHMAQQHHFKQQELVQLFNQVEIQPKIIEAISRPYEKKPWDTYRQLFLTTDRLQGGLVFWKKNQNALKQAERQYHVPANMIVAILGVETRYGSHQGDYRVIDALSTLAFQYPPRSVFFKKELAEFLLLCREHHVSPTAYLGSYAGAMGKPQFMPSSYRHYAVDFQGLAKKDLMHDDEAVIASVANYFKQSGWKPGAPVAQPALIRGNALKRIDTSLKYAYYPLRTLKDVGISPLATPFHEPEKAGVIELDTQKGHEYWLAYPNFYVITKYNTSPQYALVVYLLSEQLKQEWANVTQSNVHAFG